MTRVVLCSICLMLVYATHRVIDEVVLPSVTLSEGYIKYIDPLYKQSTIKMDLTLTASSSQEPHDIYFAVLDSSDLDGIGFPFDSSFRPMICCTESRIAATIPGCTQVNTLIIDPAIRIEWSELITIETVLQPYTAAILTSNNNSRAFYQVVIADCQEHDSSDVHGITISGTIDSFSAHGHMPAHLYPYISFYTTMLCISSFGFVASLFFWFWNRTRCTHIHIVMYSLVFLYVIESVCLLSSYSVYNHEGIKPMTALSLCVILRAARQTLGRCLLLALASGYTITRPRISIFWIKSCTCVLAVYFVSCLYYEFHCTLFSRRFESMGQLLVFELPLYLSNTALVWLVTLMLWNSLNEARARNHVKSYHMFIRLSKCLVGTSLIAILIGLWRVCLLDTNALYSQWNMFYLVDQGLPDILFAIVTAMVLTVCSPGSAWGSYQIVHDDDLGRDSDAVHIEMNSAEPASSVEL